MREVPASEVRKIDFTASHQKRKQLLNEESDDIPPVNLIQRTAISTERIDKFAKELHDNVLPCAIYRILPQYHQEFARKDQHLPAVLTDLFDPSFFKLSREDLAL